MHHLAAVGEASQVNCSPTSHKLVEVRCIWRQPGPVSKFPCCMSCRRCRGGWSAAAPTHHSSSFWWPMPRGNPVDCGGQQQRQRGGAGSRWVEPLLVPASRGGLSARPSQVILCSGWPVVVTWVLTCCECRGWTADMDRSVSLRYMQMSAICSDQIAHSGKTIASVVVCRYWPASMR